MTSHTDNWEGLWQSPLTGRNQKPRQNGVTMLIDKGLTLAATRDLLDLNALFIDFIKLSFGTTALYPPDYLRRKLALVKEFGIDLYPGGTFFEVAFWKGQAVPYLKKLMALGFESVEISDGTIELTPLERLTAIRTAQEIGLRVITEVGKKDASAQPEVKVLVNTALADLEAGASWVIIEARESGQGIGIYDQQGRVITDELALISQQLPLDRVIWEAPLKGQQAHLINTFGVNVNLGNIPPAEIMALEALRLGYRSDTWKSVIQ